MHHKERLDLHMLRGRFIGSREDILRARLSNGAVSLEHLTPPMRANKEIIMFEKYGSPKVEVKLNEGGTHRQIRISQELYQYCPSPCAPRCPGHHYQKVWGSGSISPMGECEFIDVSLRSVGIEPFPLLQEIEGITSVRLV